MPGSPYTILLVDDSPMILERISEILKDVSCIITVKKAAGFEEAVAILFQSPIDLAMLDINLHGKNGIQLLSFIKENYPFVKTIMLTNQSDNFYRNLCKRLGSDSFIDKSNEFDQITDNVMRYYTGTTV